MKSFTNIGILFILCALSTKIYGQVSKQDHLVHTLRLREINLWKGVAKKDSALWSKFLSRDYQFFTYNGTHDRNRRKEMAVHFSGLIRIDSVRFEHWRVKTITKDVVMLNYTTKAWGALRGEPAVQVGASVSIWRRSHGKWELIAGSESHIPEEEYIETPDPDWIK